MDGAAFLYSGNLRPSTLHYIVRRLYRYNSLSGSM